jgi:integrase
MDKITLWYPWALATHHGGLKLIRRYRLVNGKRVWQTLPYKQYKDLDDEQVGALLRRLNVSFELERKKTEERYNYDHAFINTATLAEFEAGLEMKATSREHIKKLMTTLHMYTLKYFIHTVSVPDPSYWKAHEVGFGKYLLEKKLSSDYIARIIQTANRLTEFLYNKWPNEVKLVRLEPISTKVLQARDLEAPNKARSKWIDEETFIAICDKLNKRILPAFKLAYYFGARRAEVLALKLDDVLEEALNVERQLVKLDPIACYKPLKQFAERRAVPYWFTTPEEAYALVALMERMHPDTLGQIFAEDMLTLKLPFQFHDTRRSFITRAIRSGKNLLDVKLAAGHGDLKTTNKYVQDDRALTRKKFKPKQKVTLVKE